MNTKLVRGTVAIGLFISVIAVKAQPTVVNPSFEMGTFGVFPGYVSDNGPITNWHAPGRAGINPGTGFSPFADNGQVPDGSKVAFIQDDGRLSQVVYGFTVGAKYVVRYYENARACCSSALPTLSVTIGGSTIVPNHSIAPVGGTNPYRLITSAPFVASATVLELAFDKRSTAPGDTTVLIDHVTIVPSADPAGRLAILTLHNTGVNNAGTPLPDNAVDSHYFYGLIGIGCINCVPYVATSAGGYPIPPWIGDNSFSAWITPSFDTTGMNDAGNPGPNHLYELRFSLAGYDPATAIIRGQWSSDDRGTDILINGVSTGQSNNGQHNAWTPFEITSGFVPGVNRLTFLVNNGYLQLPASGPTGVRVEMAGTAALAPAIPGLFNTGVDSSGTPQSDNSPEIHYSLVGVSPVSGAPYVATSAGGFPIGPWLFENTESAWIAPAPDTVGPNGATGAADYYYQTRFDLTGRDPSTAIIEGYWSTDNAGLNILINGQQTGQTNSSQFGAWTPFRITQGFVAGVNTLTFVVNNGSGETTGSGPTGLRVELRGSALSDCINLQSLPLQIVPNPWDYRGLHFVVYNFNGGLLNPLAIRRDGAFTGLNCGWNLEMDVPTCDSIDLTLVHFSQPPTATAYNAAGAVLSSATMNRTGNTAQKLSLSGPGITKVRVVSPANEALLLEVCCAPGRPATTDPQSLALRRLREDSRTPLRVHLDGGVPRFVAGHVPALPVTVDPVERAIDYLERYRDLYRLNDPRTELYLNRMVSDDNGQHLFFGQRKGQISVFGSELAVHLGPDGVLAANGNYLSDLPVEVPPTITAAGAEKIALSDANCPDAKRLGVPKLTYFNPNLFTKRGPDAQTLLAWQLSVANCGEGDSIYFIDAQSGAVLFRHNQTPSHNANKDMTIWTANNSSGFLCHYFSGTEWFDENGVRPGATPDAEGNRTFSIAHQVYNFYFNAFHRHAWDGNDGPVRIVLDDSGAAGNAFFFPFCGQLIFGNNFSVLDVLAHEFTHGVIGKSSDLVYQDQSGALNESYADVMAAMIDSANWTVGESLPRGSIRSLANPPTFRHPDDMRNFVVTTADNGGVHTNSGIPNKAAFLIAAGGTHSNITVRGIGRQKTGRLYYDVMTAFLTKNSQFIDAANLTKAAAYNYAATGKHGFTLADACSVANAFAAVGLGLPDLDCDTIPDTVDTDDDGDGVPDNIDNCPRVANADQADTDLDGTADACDIDDDNDFILDADDNCPRHRNTGQGDWDGDDIGDACEDSDFDGVMDSIDNCRFTRNPAQADFDRDFIGDICDPDDDNDGIWDTDDNCPRIANADRTDSDGDGIGDACDRCPRTPDSGTDTDNDGTDNVCDLDDDNDGIPDIRDNCPLKHNPDQHDLNGNGVGSACDPDDQPNFGGPDPHEIAGWLRFRDNYFDRFQIVVFPDVSQFERNWIPENFETEIRLRMEIDLPVQITDDQGFVVARADHGLDKVLRFHPKADTFYRPPQGPFGFRALGEEPAPPYQGRQYFLEILPTEKVEPDRDYGIRIRGSSVLENVLNVESIAKTEDGVTLLWRSIPGKTYRVQFKPSLDAAWKDLTGDIFATETTATKTDTTVGNERQRFYQVIELP